MARVVTRAWQHGEVVTAGSLARWEPLMDGMVTRVGKGNGAAASFGEAQP